MDKFKVGDKVVDNGKGYPAWAGGKVGEIVGYEGNDRQYLTVEFDDMTLPYIESELEHYSE